MSQQTMQQPAQPEKRGFKYSFKRSIWITAGWNWFLMFAGKAAEPVLTISVIYSCARLLPSVHFPVQIDNVVFLCQMVALDIGGLGLRKLAQQARRDGNEEGATFAGRVSTWLITIMCINVALSILQSIAHLPAEFIAVVEGILLIVRAILAVLYSFVIHSLHSSDQGEPHDGHPQPDVQGLIDQALAEQSQRFDRALTEQATQFDQTLDVRAAEHRAEIDRLTERFTKQIAEAVQSASERLNAQLNNLQNGHFDEQPAQPVGPLLFSLPPVNQLVRRDGESLQSFIYRLLDQNQARGPRELGRLADCSPASAKTYRDLYFEQLNSRTEHNGTDD
ncbi:MAG TPA: hypothetical protein VFN35_12580 [Ktedonobacteraceae bacterium]|nr:hypothetical protein [Ktedonobacteraceae bacterium]